MFISQQELGIFANPWNLESIGNINFRTMVKTMVKPTSSAVSELLKSFRFKYATNKV